MTTRTYMRTGEVPILFGLDRTRSEWSLWKAMQDGEDGGAGDYGKWQGRLMVPIMQGIAEDHSLRIDRAIDPKDAVCKAIMSPRCWSVHPSLTSGGRPAVIVVAQRTESSLREWKEPGSIPARSAMRYKAIAAAHGVEDVLVGVLVDGYSSRLFHVHTSPEERETIVRRVEAFVQDVAEGIEPDLDFGRDEGAIRRGTAVTKTQAASETVDDLVAERARLVAERAPVDAQTKRIDARLRQIDTHFIHLAGASGKIDTGSKLVVVERDARNNPKVTVIDKAAAPLF